MCICCGKIHYRGARSKFCSSCARKAYYRPEIRGDRRSHGENRQWDADSYLGLTPTEMDWARLAAFIDGEGSISLCPRHTPKMKSITFCGKVVVTNTDFRLAKWCMDVFGMRTYEREFVSQKEQALERNWKTCFYAQALGFRATWILRNCLPWFLLKRSQAEVVIEHQKTTSVDYWQRGGSHATQTPVEVLKFRFELKQKLSDLNRRGPAEKETEVAS